MRWIAIAAFAAFAAVGAEPAQTTTDSKPIDMTSTGGLTIDLKNHTGIAKKDVVIKRDDILVCCDEAEATYAANKIERVTCRGRVVIVRPGGTRATANVAVFLADQDKLTLTGAARVFSEEANLAGEKIIYDIGHDHLEVEGGRSRFIYKPQASDQEALRRPCPPPGVKVP